MNERQMLDLLKAKYSAPEWAIFTHVANGTGGRASRWADAVAMNLWPSRGLAIHGFEVKVTRGDWLREMRDPAKAEAISRFCDYWWLVVSDKTIVKDDEIPKGWGLLAPASRGLTVVRQPVDNPTDDVTRVFVAALLRRAVEQSADTGALAEAEQRGKDAGKAAAEEAARYRIERAETSAARYKDQLKIVEDAAGVTLNEYSTIDAESIGVALALVMKHTNAVARARQRGERLHQELTSTVETLARQLAEVESL